MAITFVNKSAFASGTNALTVGAVASVQADDLILLFVESANQAIAVPSGYTEITGSPVSTGTAAAAGGVRLGAFYRWATGADTTTSVADTGDHTTAIKVAYRGVNKTTPFDATPVAGIKTPASTSSSFPGITTTTANALIAHASGLDLDAASTATTGAATNANLTSITERHDQTVTSGVGGGLVIVDGFKATAGATGNTTATVTSTVQVYLTLALREQPATQTLTPGLYSNASALYAPTVEVGAVTLTAARFDNANTFFGHTVALGPVTLLPPLFGNVQTFYAHTVAPGAVALVASRFDNAQTFYGHTVSQGGPSQNLQAPLLTNAQTFYAHTLTAQAPVLSAPLLTNAQTFFGGQVNLRIGPAPAPEINTNQFFAPTVNRGAVTLVQASRFDNAQFFYPPFVGDAPQVDTGRNIAGGMLQNMGTLMNR